MNLPGHDLSADGLIPFPDMWENQVLETPDRIAVTTERRDWRYIELDDHANHFAVAFQNAGVRFGDRVGLCIDRSAEAIAAMLATMKLGAILVPLDTDYPVDRLGFMIDDATISLVIANERHCRSIGS